jgi:hypothetical protein
MEFDNVSRSIYFPVLVCLSLLALRAQRTVQSFSAPHSMLESGNAIDREAVERGTLINLPAIRTKLWIGYIHTARAAGKEAQDSHNAKF